MKKSGNKEPKQFQNSSQKQNQNVYRCPRCGAPMEFLHAEYFCRNCGFVEDCCSGELAQPEK